MPESSNDQIASILHDLKSGDQRAADKLFPILYDELREMAGKYMYFENANHTLQPTSLVHEVYIKFLGQTNTDWKGKTHFLAVSAQAMRRLLVDHARTKSRKKRGGDMQKVGVEVIEWTQLDVEKGRTYSRCGRSTGATRAAESSFRPK